MDVEPNEIVNEIDRLLDLYKDVGSLSQDPYKSDFF